MGRNNGVRVIESVDIDKLRKYFIIDIFTKQIEKNFREYINQESINEQDRLAKEIIKRYKDNSTSGDPESRKVIKEQIKTDLLRKFNIYEIDDITKEPTGEIIYPNINIDEYNGYIDLIIPFENPELLTTAEKFEILLYLNKTVEINGRDGAFKNLLEKYPIYEKSRKTEDYIADNFEYTEQDINKIYDLAFSMIDKQGNTPKLTFADKVEIVTQRIYEEIFGLKIIDILAYSDINEVGFADNGNYVYCWCNRKYWLSFLKLAEGEARIVQERLISWDKSIGALNESNPEKLCHRADGARITVTQEPYFSARNACVRIFNQSHSSYSDIVNLAKTRAATTAFIKTGQSIILQGGLGTGKTTTMQTMFEVLDDNLHIGLVEDHFEQHLKDKYPNKRIVEGQSINGKTLLDVVATFLRMSLDVASLGEARTGESIYAYLQLVQSVSIAAWLTAHINSPENTVARLKNMLMGVGRYHNEQAAVMDIIHNINCIYQHDIIDGQRIITQIVEIEPLVETSYVGKVDVNMSADTDTLEKLYYIQQIQSNPVNMFRLNPILDARDGKAKFVGYPSKRMIHKAKDNIKGWEYMQELIEAIKADTGKGYEELIK